MNTNARRLGVAGYFGWGSLALLVLLGAVSSGLSGAAVMFGMFVLLVALVGLIRGRVGWAHLGRRATSWIALAAAFAALTVGGLTAPPQSTSAGTTDVAATATHETATTAPTTQAPIPAVAAPSMPPATSPTKTTAPRPAPKPHRRAPEHRAHATSMGLVINAAGAVLPNRARTPGAINPAVTQANIGSTICVSGWTSTVRPSSSVTTALKESQLASGYAYKGDTSTTAYEEDHLISLELGGAPSDPANLWPEPYNSPEGARVKDQVENKLHSLICSHAITLATAQHAIATNWWAAYQTYGGSAYSGSSHTSGPRTVHHTTAPAPAPAPVAPGGATARCVDGTYSYTAHHQGACSHHGGVAVFYN